MAARWYRDAPQDSPSFEMDEADLPAWEEHLRRQDQMGIPGVWPWPPSIPLTVVNTDGSEEPYVSPPSLLQQSKALADFLSFMDDYDENEPRDEMGKWTSSGGAGIQTGTKKHLAVSGLLAAGASGLTAEHLTQHIYGKSHAEAGGALSGVVNGIQIAAPKAGYKFDKSGSGASAVYSLTKLSSATSVSTEKEDTSTKTAMPPEPPPPPVMIPFEKTASFPWTDDQNSSRAEGKSTIFCAPSSARDSIKRAVDSIPAEHAAMIKNITIESNNEKFLGGSDDTEGMFISGPGAPRIQIAQRIGNTKIKDIEGATVHELAHALDYAKNLSGKFTKVVKADAEKLTSSEKRKAEYFLDGRKERFAEAYALTYSPNKSGKYFGLSRDRAEKVFANSIAAVRALPLDSAQMATWRPV